MIDRPMITDTAIISAAIANRRAAQRADDVARRHATQHAEQAIANQCQDTHQHDASSVASTGRRRTKSRKYQQMPESSHRQIDPQEQRAHHTERDAACNQPRLQRRDFDSSVSGVAWRWAVCASRQSPATAEANKAAATPMTNPLTSVNAGTVTLCTLTTK